MSDFTLRLDNHWQVHDAHALNFGYHFSQLAVEYDVLLEILRDSSEVSNAEALNAKVNTIYADYDLNIAGLLSFDFGLRYTHNNESDQAFWEPRMTLDYQPFGNAFHFKASMGNYVQFVSQMVEYNELGLGEQFWIMSNRRFQIPAITSSQLSVGFWYERKGLFIDIEYYRKQTRGMTTLNLRFEEPSQNPYTRGKANIRGLDILLKKKWKRYSSWLSYSLDKVMYRFNQINDNRPFPATHDQRHTINWTHIFSLKKWEFSLSWNYSSGRPFTDVLGVESEWLEQEQQYQYYLHFAPRNQSRLRDYHRLDFSGHYKFSGHQKMQGKIGISIFNLYGRHNIFDKEFFAIPPEDGLSDPELLRYDRNMLSFTPNAFLLLDW